MSAIPTHHRRPSEETLSLSHGSLRIYLRQLDQWYVHDEAAQNKTSPLADDKAVDPRSRARLWCRGVAFDITSGAHLDVHSITHELIERSTAHPAAALTTSLTGQFAAIRVITGVQDTHDRVELYSDRIRSFPLFYAERSGTLWISDDLLWMSEQLAADLQETSLISMWRTAQLVSGSDTLFQEIKQLRASEVITWDGITLSAISGEHYRHREAPEMSAEELKERLRTGIKTCIHRLIQFADGAQLVVPLSGGFDSRLILTALVDAGYPNLVAFTYGKGLTPEVQISKEIADRLGVKWWFVKYTARMWRSWPKSERGRLIIDHARRSGALYHVQDPLAIAALVERGALEPNSVVVCGHSGDVHAGSVIDAKSLAAPLSIEGYLDLLSRKYFGFNAASDPPRISSDSAELKRALIDKLSRELSSEFVTRSREGLTRESLIDELERWFWRERCAKFLVQSMRTYEVHGLRWWLPLWDDAFTSLWMNVPLRHRGRVGVYHKFVDEYFKQVAGCAPPQGIIRDHHPRPVPFYKRWLLRSTLIQTLRLRVRHPFGWYHLIPFWRHARSPHHALHINAMLVDQELRWWRARQARSLKDPTVSVNARSMPAHLDYIE